jgi:molybdenum transport protein
VVFFSNHDIDAWIDEDAGSLDLTSELVGIAGRPATLTVRCRQPVRAALTEEAARIFGHLGARVTRLLPAGRDAAVGEVLLEVHGDGAVVHRGWKVAMNLLEHGCGVATRTARLVERARSVADVHILVTRKHWPGLKKVMISAAIAGGALPHRLGLAETILVFDNHLALVGGRAALPTLLARMRSASCEKKIGVECHDGEQAEQAIAAGADLIQFDKVPVAELSALCARLKADHPRVTLTAAGGVHLDNVRDYAASGVHAIVLSSAFDAPPADLEVRIEPS